MITLPLNLPKWLAENSHLLKPPINNYCVYDSHMTVMVVGGPNARSDYHINETPEFFYQYKGAMLLRIVDTTEIPADHPSSEPPPPAAFRDLPIREGELFLLPPNTPHNPIRFADTVGVVIEQPRPPESLDRLRWYCDSCRHVVYEDSFHCTDLGTQIKDAVHRFVADETLRRCRQCGETVEPVPKGVVQP